MPTVGCKRDGGRNYSGYGRPRGFVDSWQNFTGKIAKKGKGNTSSHQTQAPPETEKDLTRDREFSLAEENCKGRGVVRKKRRADETPQVTMGVLVLIGKEKWAVTRSLKPRMTAPILF